MARGIVVDAAAAVVGPVRPPPLNEQSLFGANAVTDKHDELLPVIGVRPNREAMTAAKQVLEASCGGTPYRDHWSNHLKGCRAAVQWRDKFIALDAPDTIGNPSLEQCAVLLYRRPAADHSWSANPLQPAPAGM